MDIRAVCTHNFGVPNIFVGAIKIFVAAATVAVVTSCTATAPADNERPLVLTTFTVLADMARNVAGEHVRFLRLLAAEQLSNLRVDLLAIVRQPFDMAARLLDLGLRLRLARDEAGNLRFALLDDLHKFADALGQSLCLLAE